METETNWVKLMGPELIGSGCGEKLQGELPLAGALRSLDSNEFRIESAAE